jgi:hypothetical protein
VESSTHAEAEGKLRPLAALPGLGRSDITGQAGFAMLRFYYIYEKARHKKAKFLSVFSAKKIALTKLKEFAAQTPNQVYVMDVLSGVVIARRNV